MKISARFSGERVFTPAGKFTYFEMSETFFANASGRPSRHRAR
jgi:hypothetical protein